MELDGIPRRAVESDPLAALMAKIKRLEDQVRSLERGTTLRNASISGGDGLRVLDSNGNARVSINTTDGAVVAYDSTGAAVARFGPLANSNPGNYGVEVKYNGTWVQVGSVAWANISNKPTAFSPSAHGHYGSDIVSAVAQADGSSYGYNNVVAGTTPYALWVGNDGGFHFGRSTSSARYKHNIKKHDARPGGVLALQPVVYDRNDQLTYPTDPVTRERLIGPPNKIPGTQGEYGLIAEQVAQCVPELVQWFEGNIDGIRYDLLSVALLDVVKDQELRIKAMENAIRTRVMPTYTRPLRPDLVRHRQSSAAPAIPPAPVTFEVIPPSPDEILPEGVVE